MRDVEEELNIKKKELMDISAPENMEKRLRNVLYSERAEKKGSSIYRWPVNHRVLAAALLVFIFIFAFNYDVFAYYGKKILGYDNVIYGSVRDLNNLGMGQEINKSYRFKNGLLVTVNGIMMDENKLIVMYSVQGDIKDKIQYLDVQPLKGLLGTYYQTSGYGQMNDKGNEIKWVQEFKSPSPFDRNLTFGITSGIDDSSKGETARIKFSIDMDKAIKRTVKCSINKSVEFGGTTYRFTALSASPLSIIIEGKIEPASEDERKLYSPGDLNSPSRNIDMELVETYISGGKTVSENLQKGSAGINSGMEGISFSCEFDGLKPGLKSLALNIVKIDDVKIIDRSLDITTLSKDIMVIPDNSEIYIKSVKAENGNTVVTFSSGKNVAFTPALMIGSKQSDQLSEKSADIEEDGKQRTQKVIVFKGSGNNMQLLFKTISHETYINKQIIIYK